MVTIKKISKSQLYNLVELSYQGDNELIEKIHPAKTDLKGSVQTTIDMIEGASTAFEIHCFKVITDKKPIGYFVTGGQTGIEMLYSFGINKKYRKKDILITWWNEMKKYLHENFVCFLYNNNERAINFLKKNGMTIHEEKDEVITLINLN